MSVPALLRFAPVYTSAILDDPKLAREVMVQRGALERVSRDEPIPVLVDHDSDRQVGTVHELFVAPDVVGGVVSDWYFASVALDAPPGWLKRNGGVSWSYRSLQKQDVNGSTRLLRGLIDEVSILSPSVRPPRDVRRSRGSGSPRTREARSSSTTSRCLSVATTKRRLWCGERGAETWLNHAVFAANTAQRTAPSAEH